MKYIVWEKKRAKLHHDWLKNSYMMFLNARAESLDDAVKSCSAIREDVVEQFFEFKYRTIDLENLIDETVTSLSPAQLVEEYPLCNMDGDNKKWLAEVIHTLYCKRTGIEKKVEEIKFKLLSIKDLYNLLVLIVNGKSGGLLEKAGEKPFIKLRFEIQELSMMITSLPHEVQIV